MNEYNTMDHVKNAVEVVSSFDTDAYDKCDIWTKIKYWEKLMTIAVTQPKVLTLENGLFIYAKLYDIESLLRQ